MRRAALLLAGVFCGALVVSGQEGQGDALDKEIDRLRALLNERIQARAPEAERRTVLRTYDVADLCTGIEDHPQPPENLRPSQYEPPEETEPAEPLRMFEVDQLIELIRVGVEPQSWDLIEGADIQPKNDRLFVRTTARIHGKIAKMLAWCRANMDRRVSVDVAVVPVAEGDVALLSAAPELTADEAERLLAQPLGAVTLAGWDGQVLGGAAGRDIEYVQDFDVETAEGSAIGDPIRSSVFAGCSAQVQACLDDGKGAILHCRLELSRVAEPIPVHATAHGNVELPTKRLTRVEASFWAPLDRTVVAGGCTVGEEACVILVTVRRR